MKLILNGESYSEAVDKNNIADKIKECISRADEQGRLIKHVYLDEESKPELIKNPESIHEFAGKTEIDKVEIVTATQNDLIYETLETITEYLDKLTEYVNELARSVKVGNTPDKESLLQLTDSLEWVYQASNGLMISFQDDSLKEEVDGLQVTFSEILSVLKREDYMSFAEILEYQLVEKLEALKKSLAIKLEQKKNTP